MTRQKSSLSMIVLVALFGLAIIVQFSKIPPLLAEDEMDEELRSTISSDPVNRGRRTPAPSAAPAPTESAPPPAAEPSASSSGGGESEGGEWQTMRSETHRPWAGGLSSIQVDLAKNKIITPKISFAANSDAPTPHSVNILKRLATTLGKRPDLTVRIEGHTDSIGYDQPNLELSQRRADHVRDILVQNGVPANRLQSVGMGDRYPVASSTTLEGQEKNRRVEFLISGVAAAPAPAQPAAPVAAAPVPQQPAAPVPAAPLPVAPAPAAPAPPAPQQAAPAPAAIPVAAAPAPQATPPAPAAIPAAPAPAPGLVAPPQPAPATPPPAPFGALPQ